MSRDSQGDRRRAPGLVDGPAHPGDAFCVSLSLSNVSQALNAVGLLALMERTSGIPEVTIGLIDGPVALGHPDLASGRLHYVPGHASEASGACGDGQSPGAACVHGTFVAGILSANRSSMAPAICPGCTVLLRPIFTNVTNAQPQATPAELAQAIVECVDAGARILNVSAAIAQATVQSEQALKGALDHAARRGAIVIAAAGNHAAVGGSPLTSHPWVIPVVACTAHGQPSTYSNLGHSIGRHGLRAPGDRITSLGAPSGPLTLSGTSAAAPFVTGAIALLWSELPRTSASAMRHAVTQAAGARRATVFPPLLNAWAAHQALRR